MNVVYQSLGLLLLVTGALSAAIATLGGKCVIGVDTCSVNGAVCDKASQTCVCQFGYVQSGAICSRPALGLCGTGMCKSRDTMTCDAASNQCKCDASKGYIASGADCVCDSAKFFSVKSGGGCIGKVGAACTAASDCVTGLVCTSSKCACDTTKNYAAGSDGAASCTCASGYPVDSNGLCCATGKTNSNGICCNPGFIGSNGACTIAVGGACTADADCITGMKCTNSKCACDTALNYAAGADRDTSCSCDAATFFTNKTGGGCIGAVGAVCAAATDCVTGMVCTSSKCACDTTLNYLAGTDNDASCAGCATGYTLSTGLCCATGKTNSNGVCCAAFSTGSNGVCIGNVGAACSAASDCRTGMVCTSSKCACDTTKNYAAGSDGAVTCTCNAATFFTSKSGGGCIGAVGAACTAASDCVTGMVCTNSKCACDTTKNFVAGTNGATSCTCATDFTLSSFYGKCAINVGKPCTRDSTYVPCVDNAVCDRETDTCKCDSTAGYMIAGTTCSTTTCISGYTMVSGRCVADLNGFCIPAAQSGVCVTGATCLGNTTTVPQCLCSNQYDYKFSCSGAGGVVASLTCLLMALFMTSRLM